MVVLLGIDATEMILLASHAGNVYQRLCAITRNLRLSICIDAVNSASLRERVSCAKINSSIEQRLPQSSCQYKSLVAFVSLRRVVPIDVS